MELRGCLETEKVEIAVAVSFTFKALKAAEMYVNVNSSGLLPQPTVAHLTEVNSLRSRQSKFCLQIAKALLIN